MSKKKKEQKGLERKITSLISQPTLKEFNYKQIAFALGVNDTKGRNDIIKILNILLKKEKIIKVGRGKFVAPAIQGEIAEGVLGIPRKFTWSWSWSWGVVAGEDRFLTKESWGRGYRGQKTVGQRVMV